MPGSGVTRGFINQESAILNAAALLVICPSEYHATTNFPEGDFWGVSVISPFRQGHYTSIWIVARERLGRSEEFECKSAGSQ
jgi:hypothetical protein